MLTTLETSALGEGYDNRNVPLFSTINVPRFWFHHAPEKVGVFICFERPVSKDDEDLSWNLVTLVVNDCRN